MEFIPATGMALITAAMVALLTILLSWVVAVFVAQWLSGQHSGREMPWFGKVIFLVFMTSGVFLGLTIVQLLWGTQLGSFGKIAIWTIISIGLLVAFRSGSYRPMWERVWIKKQSVVLVALIMVIGVPTAPHFAEMLGDVTVNSADSTVKDQRPPIGEISLEVVPPNDGLTVGTPALLGVIVDNQSGNDIRDVQLTLLSSGGFSAEKSPLRIYSNNRPLSYGKKWSPDFFIVKPLKGGEQSFNFSLTYTDSSGTTQRNPGQWIAKVSGPVLVVERRIYATPPLVKGQEVDVQIYVRNAGEAPAYNMQLTPGLGIDFRNEGSPVFEPILNPGEGKVFPSYRTVAAEAVEGSEFAPPSITFEDTAKNGYSYDLNSASVSVINFICLSPDECRQQNSIDILRPSADYVPPQPAGNFMPALFIVPGELVFQIPPGGSGQQKLILRHDGDSHMRVDARVITSEVQLVAEFLEKFQSNMAVSAGKDAELPVSFSMPNETPLGNYEGTLVLQLSDRIGRAIGEPYKIKIKIEVSTVLITHSISSPNVAVGEDIIINTLVRNVSDFSACVQILESIPQGGISIISLDNEPIGTEPGITGEIYSQMHKLSRNHSVNRTIVISARDADPEVKHLVGEVRYRLLKDGEKDCREDAEVIAEGSSSHTVSIHVDPAK